MFGNNIVTNIDELIQRSNECFNSPIGYGRLSMLHETSFGQNSALVLNDHQYFAHHDINPNESFSFKKPDNFKVKEAKKAELSEYKYTTCYKYNKKSGRNLRYYICQYDNCGRLFNKTWNFIDHVRIHTGDKPFKCDVCHRGFAQKGNLNKHKRLHWTKDY